MLTTCEGCRQHLDESYETSLELQKEEKEHEEEEKQRERVTAAFERKKKQTVPYLFIYFIYSCI